MPRPQPTRYRALSVRPRAGHVRPLQHPQIYFIPYSANIPAPLCYTVPMGVTGMTDAAGGWLRFAQSGSVYDYLAYKLQQNAAQEGMYADGNDRTCAASGQGGGGGQDHHDPDA